MKRLAERVAVITGAASGIGRALALRCAREKMKVVLADVERETLAEARAELVAAGATVHAVFADVSRPEEVERLAEMTLERFGAVHLLFNNAGVGLIGPPLWETTLADWDWILGVNLRGVVNGVHVFVPIMLEQATEGHIVNTASAAGLVAPPGMGAYSASKAAVISLSETLHHELALQRSRVDVSVLCPGLVKTAIVDASRNRPPGLCNEPEHEASRLARYAAEVQAVRDDVANALPPSAVADQVFVAIQEQRFYIFTHPWIAQAAQARVRSALAGRAPWQERGKGKR